MERVIFSIEGAYQLRERFCRESLPIQRSFLNEPTNWKRLFFKSDLAIEGAFRDEKTPCNTHRNTLCNTWQHRLYCTAIRTRVWGMGYGVCGMGWQLLLHSRVPFSQVLRRHYMPSHNYWEGILAITKNPKYSTPGPSARTFWGELGPSRTHFSERFPKVYEHIFKNHFGYGAPHRNWPSVRVLTRAITSYPKTFFFPHANKKCTGTPLNPCLVGRTKVPTW